jgi:hypothetical protein
MSWWNINTNGEYLKTIKEKQDARVFFRLFTSRDSRVRRIPLYLLAECSACKPRHAGGNDAIDLDVRLKN